MRPLSISFSKEYLAKESRWKNPLNEMKTMINSRVYVDSAREKRVVARVYLRERRYSCGLSISLNSAGRSSDSLVKFSIETMKLRQYDAHRMKMTMNNQSIMAN
jgi:hypothetical protein